MAISRDYNVSVRIPIKYVDDGEETSRVFTFPVDAASFATLAENTTNVETQKTAIAAVFASLPYLLQTASWSTDATQISSYMCEFDNSRPIEVTYTMKMTTSY